MNWDNLETFIIFDGYLLHCERPWVEIFTCRFHMKIWLKVLKMCMALLFARILTQFWVGLTTEAYASEKSRKLVQKFQSVLQ